MARDLRSLKFTCAGNLLMMVVATGFGPAISTEREEIEKLVHPGGQQAAARTASGQENGLQRFSASDALSSPRIPRLCPAPEMVTAKARGFPPLSGMGEE